MVMNKTPKWIIVVGVFFIVTVLVLVSLQRRYEGRYEEYEDILFQMVENAGSRHSPLCGYGAQTYRFIVKNDGTLISYYGVGRCFCGFEHDDFARVNLMQVVHERAIITLSEEDFQYLNELLELMAEMRDGERGAWLAMFRTRIFYDGYIYSNEAFPIARCEETGDLVDPFSSLYSKIWRLTNFRD